MGQKQSVASSGNGAEKNKSSSQEQEEEEEAMEDWQKKFEEAAFEHRLEVELGCPAGEIPMSQVWRKMSVKKMSQDGAIMKIELRIRYGKYSRDEKTVTRVYVYDSEADKIVSFEEK